MQAVDEITVLAETKDLEAMISQHPSSQNTTTGCSELVTRMGSEEESLSANMSYNRLCTTELMLNPPNSTVTIKRSIHALPSASLTFKDLTFSLPSTASKCRGGAKEEENGGRVILAPCSGHFEAGDLVAIMGPSGCGKTTLLDMLAAKKSGRYGGEVFVNGRPRDWLFRRIAAYVSQEDVMPPHWTVQEAIEFNATLKRQPKRAHCSLKGWVETLIGAFDLQSVANSRIGSTEARGISGGQRRRTTLARGVAACPSLLFCDEPTSGLSATDAETCVKALRIVTKRLGITCLVVIHQPRYEVTTLFDTLVLLTSNPGRMAYFGSTSGALLFWSKCGFPVPEHMNPTDHYLDLLTPNTQQDESAKLVSAFNEQIRPRQRLHDRTVRAHRRRHGLPLSECILALQVLRYSVPFGTQLVTLLRRKFLLASRDFRALGLPLLMPVIQGTLIGYMFTGVGQKDDMLKQIMFSFCLVTMLCLAGLLTLVVLITDRIQMKHEASEALYCEGASSLASFMVDVPLSLLGAFLNVSIMTAFGDLESDILRTVVCWSLLLFMFYDSMFALIGAVAKDTRQAQVIVMPFVSLFMLFNGFVVAKADAPKPLLWIFYISPNQYAMQAIIVRLAEHFPLSGPAFVEEFGYSDDNNGIGICVLCSMIILLRVGQQVALRYMNNVQR
eukprot:CAMPEP_0206599380 /NCGR_PEP_ID=MMETSP0325_2-20121206/45155_1 /ASSEMBLY_ACC=CAM_ASM_000347 /TAXON_ID=2866 /ORGANISM="Crypthecodinium cohnii, Strain Seligo" /LENGTH=670 /DNA_ID=CAMNT_0054110461 /DNA_START=53 /DNA_END=2065 /DNA_ORIENTATION=-